MGLDYINNISGEIHNVFVDPSEIRAIPDDDLGTMRVKSYFVHSALCAVNKSIYHSSAYGKKKDEEWEEIKKERIEALRNSTENNTNETNYLNKL